MTWRVVYLPEAADDFRSLDKSHQIKVAKAIRKVSTNPLPRSEGGLGLPLGNRKGRDLTGFLKIRLLNEGIRIVYRLIRHNEEMLIVVIGMREDEDAYRIACKHRVRAFVEGRDAN